MIERRIERRLIVRFVSERAGEVEALAEALARDLPAGRVVRVSRRGRAVLAVDGDTSAIAGSVAERPEVEWAEPDTVDHAVDDDEHG